MNGSVLDRLHLRSVKCPGCNARIPPDPGAKIIQCEFCQLEMEVVEKPVPKSSKVVQYRFIQESPPQVQPHIRSGVYGLSMFVALIMLIVPFVFFRGPFEGEWATEYSTEDLKDVVQGLMEPEHVSKANGPSEVLQKVVTRPRPDTKTVQTQGGLPNGYVVAKFVKASQKGCSPNDLTTVGHPLWYSPTITLSVDAVRFKNVSVTIKASNTASEVHFKGDHRKNEKYTRPVFKKDINQRKAQVASCIKKKITKMSIPKDSPLRSKKGKVRFSLTRDGVPYGVKSLGGASKKRPKSSKKKAYNFKGQNHSHY